jgi:hypothetical protein
MYIFEFESSRRFHFSFTDFSLLYRCTFAQDISKVTVHERIQHLYHGYVLAFGYVAAVTANCYQHDNGGTIKIPIFLI